jgi:NAD(P)-dependent dehydrogenase (short-subunit alcohol dehydrogenase family)
MSEIKRVVLITGVAGGIGRAAANAFDEAGWNVVGADLQTDIKIKGVRLYIPADIAQPRVHDQIIGQIQTLEGRLDALVNNAAVQICKPLVEMSIEEWDAVMSVNLRSVFLTVRSAFPLLKQNSGAIVNVSSVHALATSENIAAYSASKGALLALTRAMALEFGEDIRVNAVLPGAVDTQMLRAGLGRGHLEPQDVEQQVNELGSKCVLKRVGSPDEIARTILFLADSRQSSYITGQAMVVDGGATARLSTE